MSSIKRNLGYQTIYQILTTCMPLITSPYLARTLGATQQGIFSYTQSVVNYFVLFGMLGVENYGVREIAACGENKEERSRKFWNIYAFQIVTSSLSIVIYIIYLLGICRENVFIAALQSMYLLGAIIDVNWLFFGTENFKITVTRNIVVKLVSVAAILLLVKDAQDLWIYTLIMAGSTAASNAVLWKYVPGEIRLSAIRDITRREVVSHVKPNIILFVPALAMSVYHIMDKTMLGILSTYDQVGFYYNADKVINIVVGVLTGVGTVVMPRATSMVESGQKEEADSFFTRSILLMVTAASAMSFGVAAISNEFTPFFFGDGFETCIGLIIVLSPVMIIKAVSVMCRMQVLIPRHMEKTYSNSVIAGALVNIFVNIALIPAMGAMGAVIGTLFAELTACTIQIIRIDSIIPCRKALVQSCIYIIIGISMFAVVRFAAEFMSGGLVAIIIEIIIGAAFYGLCCVIYWGLTRNFMFELLQDIIIKR